jgi:CHAT domain-containing protein
MAGSGREMMLADTLYDTLIRPVAPALVGKSTIVAVADGDLQQVPFAALHDRQARRYVIEDYQVVQAPNASFFATTIRRARTLPPRPLETALLVGNPSDPGSGKVANELAPLPGSEAEVVSAAKQYRLHDVLVGRAATKRRFVDGAPQYDVVHFGGHAFANVEYPLMSRLAFSAGSAPGDHEPLFAYEISRMRFTRTRLVVLAACSTAAGAVSRSEGVMSLARPFLVAGVPLVVASQWDVNDRATEHMFTIFHQVLTASHNPIHALRSAQLEMMRSGNAGFAGPVSWAAFVAIGTALQQ